MIKTITADELISILRTLQSQKSEPIQIVLASDEEGNSYGTFDKEFSWGFLQDNKPPILAFYPAEQIDEDEFE